MSSLSCFLSLCTRIRIPPILLALAGTGSLLAGCSEPRPYYYWGSYQDQLYDHFLQKTAPDAQIQAMEKDLHQAHRHNQHLPPGYYAFMGLLYVENGQDNKAYNCFVTEKTLFPEATPYMNFLLKIPNKPEDAKSDGKSSGQSSSGKSSLAKRKKP